MGNKIKTLTVDEALVILQCAKEKVGGNACLILSLTKSAISDCDVNDMVIQSDGENRYVEVRATHPELVENESHERQRDIKI